MIPSDVVTIKSYRICLKNISIVYIDIILLLHKNWCNVQTIMKHTVEVSSFVCKHKYIRCNRWIATTLNKPIAARRVFPCWDQPDVKLTFNISINHPTREEILSNMPKERTLPADENGMRWTYFNKTPPISFYQVAIVVIDKNTVSKITLNEKKNITWYTLEYKNTIIFAQHLIDLFDKSLVSYTQVNKSDIMPKTDYIVMSKPPMKIIESPGLVIIR